MERTGYIYVMAHPKLQGCKVGVAIDPYKRLMNANVHCPCNEFHMVEKFPVFDEDPYELEKKIFSYLTTSYGNNLDTRLKGEWFDLTPERTVDLIRRYFHLRSRAPQLVAVK